jgi:mannitol/fructose-specific phosphotransferase system IIA component (Ntr-type)
MKNSPHLESVSEQEIYDALKKREELGSTGFGNSIAIPHCSFDTVEQFAIGILISTEGIDFDALDEKPTSCFVIIVGPSSQKNEHIHLLSSISRILNTRTVVSQLLQAGTSDEIVDIFHRQSVEDANEQTRMRVIFHVFIQDEDYFERILQIFSEIRGCSLSVVEGNNASYYLHGLPLFSAFLTNNTQRTHRIIIALVPKPLSNEALRQISTATGDISDKSGICVVAQETFYCLGSLDY